MAQTGRLNVRYVDPQRRYTVVLGPSWNAPFGALPHNDRAGTHDGADGRCGSYAHIGGGQAAMWITSKNFCRSSCQTRHNAVQQNLFLLDHLVGKRELRGTYVRFRQPRTFSRKRLSAWLLSEVRGVGIASVSLGACHEASRRQFP